MIRPGLLASARHVKDEMEDLPSDFLDRRFTGRNTSCVNVDEIMPLLGESGARGNFDNRHQRQSIRAAFAGCENVKVHGGELLCSADKIAGGRGGEDQSFRLYFFSLTCNGTDRAASGLCNGTERLFDDVGESTAFVARSRVGAPVGGTPGEIFVVPSHFVDKCSADFFSGSA